MRRVQRMLKRKIKSFLNEGETFLAGIPVSDDAQITDLFDKVAVETTMITQVGIAVHSEIETDGTKDYQFQSYLIATDQRLLDVRRTLTGKVSRIAGEIRYFNITLCEFKTRQLKIKTEHGDTFLDTLKYTIPKIHLKDAEIFANEVSKKISGR